MHELMRDYEGKLDAIKNKVGIFDREYNKVMEHHEYYKPASKEKYDTYRDLQRVFNDPVCQQRGCNERSTILIDSESKKCQLWLDNTIISQPYTK